LPITLSEVLVGMINVIRFQITRGNQLIWDRANNDAIPSFFLLAFQRIGISPSNARALTAAMIYI